tara:strand:- start:41 stop:241 length:201 start_codon:yes stop_codon:yes gene_type:complete
MPFPFLLECFRFLVPSIPGELLFPFKLDPFPLSLSILQLFGTFSLSLASFFQHLPFSLLKVTYSEQ